MDWLYETLFSFDGFPPRWKCGIWPDPLGWSHIVSDALIAIAYIWVAVVAWSIRSKLLANTATAIAVCAFFVFCSGDHIQFAAQFWWPNYRFHGYIWKPLEAICAYLFLALVVLEVRRWKTPQEVSVREAEFLSVSNAAGPFYLVDRSGCCTLINGPCLTLLGYKSAEAVLGKNMHDLIHHTHEDGSDYPIRECEMFRAMENQVTTSSDKDTVWTKDRRPVHVSWSSVPVMHKGQCVGTRIELKKLSVMDLIDVVVSKETGLGADNTRLRAIIRALPTAMVAADERFVVFAMSDAATELTGRDELQVVGRHAHVFARDPHAHAEKCERFAQSAESELRTRIEVPRAGKADVPCEIRVQKRVVLGRLVYLIMINPLTETEGGND